MGKIVMVGGSDSLKLRWQHRYELRYFRSIFDLIELDDGYWRTGRNRESEIIMYFFFNR